MRPQPIQQIRRLFFLFALGFFSVGTALSVSSNIFHLPESRPGCDTPIYWKLGAVDSRFPLDRKAFLRTAMEAESVWERPLRKDLFVYDPTASFVVTTVFDDRQKMTYDKQSLDESIERYNETATALKGAYDGLRAGFERDKGALDLRIRTYEKDLASYNEDVRKANAAGGATPDKIASFEKRQNSLQGEQSAISKESERLSATANKINATTGTLNQKTDSVKKNLADFRSMYGEPQPFVEGLYESPLRSITVYQFENADDLRLVLAHEFGHALGIEEHVAEDQSSVMYPMMGGQDLNHPTLTEADIAAYEAACPIKTESPRDAYVRYLVTTPFSQMSLNGFLGVVHR
ncbi:MAG: matrixin family metalloprotease [Candidatus Moraniibacteriota bacterium]